MDDGNEITDGDGNRGSREEETGKGGVEEDGEEEELEGRESLLRRKEEGGGEDGVSASCMAEAGELQALSARQNELVRTLAVVVEDGEGEGMLLPS